MAVPQVMARQGTGANVLGLGTGPAGLFVAAAMEMPVGLEFGATDSSAELLVNVAPGRPAVSLHVIVGDRIGDALVAQSGHQPIEHNSGVAVAGLPLGPCQPAGRLECRQSMLLTRRGHKRHGSAGRHGRLPNLVRSEF